MSAPNDPLTPLDERASAAAADVRSQAAERPVPPFDPHRAVVTELPTGRPGSRPRFLAVAAVVLVIAAVAGLLVVQSRGDDGDDDKATVTSGDPRPFVAGDAPGDIPEGLVFAGVGEITGEEDPADGAMAIAGTGAVSLFGPADDEPRLAVAAFADGEEAGFGTDAGDPIELPGGRQAVRWDGKGLGDHVLLVTDERRTIVLITSEDPGDWFESAAAAATVDGDGRVELGGAELPAGWRALGEVPELLTLASPSLATLDPDAMGKYAIYSSPGATETGTAESSGTVPDDQTAPEPELPPSVGMVTVASTPGDVVQLHAATLVADTTSTTTVRGHPALVTTSNTVGGFTTRTVAWVERPGELIRLAGDNVGEDELLAMAEGLRPVPPGEWKDLVERSQLGEFDPANADAPPQITVGSGEFADGARWRLYATEPTVEEVPDPSVDLAVALDSPGDSSSITGSGGEIGGTSDPAFLSSTEVDTAGRRFGGVLLRPEVARLELRRGDDVLAEPGIVGGGGFRGAAYEITEGSTELVAYAADGTELSRRTLSDSGSTATTIDTGAGTSSGSSSGSGS